MHLLRHYNTTKEVRDGMHSNVTHIQITKYLVPSEIISRRLYVHFKTNENPVNCSSEVHYECFIFYLIFN